MDDLVPKTPIEQSVHAIHAEDTPYEQETVDPKMLAPDPEIDPASKQKAEAHHYRPDQTPGWKMFLECVVGAAVICYTVAAFQQVVAMNATLAEIQKQTPKIIESGDAAKSASQTASETLKEQQTDFALDRRPYMVADAAPHFLQNGIVPNVEITANLTVKNIGRSPATKDQLQIALLTYRPTDKEHLKRFVQSAFGRLEQESATGRKGLVIAPPNFEQDIAPNASMFLTTPPLVLSSEDFRDYESGRLVIFHMSIDTYSGAYSDALGEKFRTDSCFFHQAADDMKIWHLCDYHNTIR